MIEVYHTRCLAYLPPVIAEVVFMVTLFVAPTAGYYLIEWVVT